MFIVFVVLGLVAISVAVIAATVAIGLIGYAVRMLP